MVSRRTPVVWKIAVALLARSAYLKFEEDTDVAKTCMRTPFHTRRRPTVRGPKTNNVSSAGRVSFRIDISTTATK